MGAVGQAESGGRRLALCSPGGQCGGGEGAPGVGGRQRREMHPWVGALNKETYSKTHSFYFSFIHFLHFIHFIHMLRWSL